jgi:hypothetical protein
MAAFPHGQRTEEHQWMPRHCKSQSHADPELPEDGVRGTVGDVVVADRPIISLAKDPLMV